MLSMAGVPVYDFGRVGIGETDHKISNDTAKGPFRCLVRRRVFVNSYREDLHGSVACPLPQNFMRVARRDAAYSRPARPWQTGVFFTEGGHLFSFFDVAHVLA